MTAAAPAHNFSMHGFEKVSWWVLGAVLAGCNGKPEGEASSASEGAETGTGTEAEATLGHSSAPEPTDGKASEPSSGPGPEGGSSTGPEDSVTTGVATTEGEELSVCALVCQHSGECGLSEDVAGCTAVCEADLARSEPTCAAATEAMLACFVGLSCEHLEKAQDGDPDNPCGSEQIEAEDLCAGEVACDHGAGGDFEGTACMFEILCPGDPAQRMECDTEECVCLVGGEPVGTCPAEDVCKDLTAIPAKGASCCGFPEVDP